MPEVLDQTTAGGIPEEMLPKPSGVTPSEILPKPASANPQIPSQESDRSTSMLPPGPPPSPHLKWEPKTHRWINPNKKEPSREEMLSNEMKQLYEMAKSPDERKRVEAAKQIDQTGLKTMLRDKSARVQYVVASRITDKDSLLTLSKSINLSVRSTAVLRLAPMLNLEDPVIKILDNLNPSQLKQIVSHLNPEIIPLLEKGNLDMRESLLDHYVSQHNAIGMRAFVNDESDTIRRVVAKNADDETLLEMANDKSPEVRVMITNRIDPSHLSMFLNDPDEYVRANVALRGDKALREKLLGDPSPLVLSKLLDSDDNKIILELAEHHISHIASKAIRKLETKYLPKFANYINTRIRQIVAERMEPKDLPLMMEDEEERIRKIVATRIPEKHLASMMKDHSHIVRNSVASRIAPEFLSEMLSREDDMSVLRTIASRNHQESLHQMKSSVHGSIRRDVAARINQSGLQCMMKDESSSVREIVANRLDRDHLRNMMMDSSPQIRFAVAKRLKRSDLVEMSKQPGLSVSAKNIIDYRLKLLDEITDPTKAYFDKHHTLPTNLSESLIKRIKLISSEDQGVTANTAPIFSELYLDTPFESIHRDSVDEWERSSSSDWGFLLKYSVGKHFDGNVVHDEQVDNDNFEGHYKELEGKIGSEHLKHLSDYVVAHRNLTQRFLEIAFPGKTEFTLYRGTTSAEIKSLKGEKVKLTQNPVSSWTLLEDVAHIFAKDHDGVVIGTTVDRSEIWSTFASHAYEGNEREILLIGKSDREGEVLKSYEYED